MYEFVKGTESEHEASISEIHKLEMKYHIEFPEVLKDYYSKYDGNSIALSMITIDNYDCEVARIVPIIADKTSFETIVDLDRRDGFLPNTFYPFARDRGGNYYYWDSNSNHVYLVFSDDFDNPLMVSGSVKEFFSMMRKVGE